MNTLRQAKIGDTVKVVKLHGEGAVKRRIMDMGITKGLRSMFARLHRWATPLKSRCAVMSFHSARRTLK